jgi:phage-related protein
MTIVPKVAGVIKTVQTAFASLNAIMLANPIVLIIAVIATLIAIFVLLWNKCDDFQEFWTGVWESIQTAVTTVMNSIKTEITTVWNAISKAVSTVMQTIRGTISTLWNGIKFIITGIVNGIKDREVR